MPNKNHILQVICILATIGFGLNAAFEIKKRNSEITFPKNFGPNIYAPDYNSAKAINFPKLNLKLPIFQANITNGSAALIDNGVSMIGYEDKLVVYGHNWPSILGKALKIKKGDKVTIESDDKTDVYITEGIYTVTPDQTHILNQSSKNTLTIITCTGFLDSKRLVIVAKKLS